MMKAENLRLVDYLNMVKPSIPENIISPKNYEEILRIASFFPSGITSYIGFETRITKKDIPTNLLFAISSRNKEREFSVNSESILLKAFSHNETWIRIFNFAKKWQKAYNNKILGIWFEFDPATFLQDIPIPNFFMHIHPIHKRNANISWITEDIFPLLTGYDVSKEIEKTLNKCIKALPEKASIFQVGTMINRAIEGIRIVVKRIEAKDIMAYLKSIGYDADKGMGVFIKELSKHVTRFVLNFDVLEGAIGSKMGIECGFYPKQDFYIPDNRWKKFLDYLVKKKICHKDKRDFLINYEGIINADDLAEEVMKKLKPVTKISHDDYIGVVVKQIGHIKIVFSDEIEAKAYYGIRLWGYVR